MHDTEEVIAEDTDLRTTGTIKGRQLARSVGFGLLVGCVGLFAVLAMAPLLSKSELAVMVLLCGLIAIHSVGRKILKMALGALAVFGVVVLFSPAMKWSFESLDVSEAPRKADVIVVLGAGFYCGSSQLSGISVARTTKALSLFRDGYAPEMTISDNLRSPSSGCPSQAKVTESFIKSMLGEDAPAVVTLSNMRSTQSEVEAISELKASKRWKTVMVVTSPTHSRRAVDMFRSAGVDAFVVAADEPYFDTEMRTPGDRAKALAPVLREFAGLAKRWLTE